MAEDVHEDIWKEAKEELDRAIKKFVAQTEPKMFVTDWALVTAKDSIELSAVNQSLVSLTVPYGQAFFRSTELLTHGLHASTHF